MKLFSVFGELLLKDTASSEMDKISNKAKGLSGVFESSFGKIGSLALKLGSIIGIGFGIKELATKGYELAESASNLSEAQNVVEQTYKKSAASIEAWTQTTAKSAGISQTASTQWVGFMGAMLKSSGVTEQKAGDMSKSLVQLTGDMSSFYNVGTDDMWEKIRSGISGETEPLKALGINMSVANLQAFALSEGIKKPYAQMSQSEQTILRYNYLMNTTKDAQGDFGRTLSTSFANQVRVAQMNFETLGRNIGTMLLPAFNNAVTWFNGHMPQIQDAIQKAIIGAGNAIKTLSPIISGIIKDIMQIASNLMPKLSGSSGDLGKNLLDLAKGGLTTLKDILDWIAQHGETTRVVIIAISTAFATWKTIESVISTVNNVKSAINTAKDIFTTFSNTTRTIKSGIDTARIAFMYLNDGVLSVSTRISNFGSSVLNILGGGLTKIGSLAKSAGSAILDFGKAAVQGAISLAKMTLELGKQAIAWIAQKAQIIATTIAEGAATIAQTALNLAMSLNPIGIIIIAIAGLVAAIVVLYNKNESFRNLVNEVWNTIKSVIGSVINAVIGFFHSLVSGVESAGNGIRNAFNSVLSWFSSLPSRFVQFGANMINGLRNGISSVMGSIGSVISSGFNSAISFITSLPGRALSWGRDFIDGLKNGIMSGIGGIINAVSGVADKIKSFLHFSVPDQGPLTDYETWMPDFMGGLSRGIDKNKFKVIDSLKSLTSDMKLNSKINVAGTQIEGSANINTANNNNKPKQPYVHQTILNSRVIAQETYEDISELQEKKTQQDGRNIGYDSVWSNI